MKRRDERGNKEDRMSYIDPETVHAPKSHWKLHEILFNTGNGGWSVASGEWDGEESLAIRWNGREGDDGVGSPQSRGYATWFLIPSALESALRREVETLSEERIICRITKPEEYEYGAWSVEIRLADEIASRITVSDLVFEIPNIERRLINPDRGYGVFSGDRMCGKFSDSVWISSLYTNGIAEDENPSTIDMVRRRLIESVTIALRARGITP